MTTFDPICSCGHPKSRHEWWTETVYFNGLFNPDLAGTSMDILHVSCLGDEDPQGEPCPSLEHVINYPEVVA